MSSTVRIEIDKHTADMLQSRATAYAPDSGGDLRPPTTGPSMCRNQPSIWFQLATMRLTSILPRATTTCGRRMADPQRESNQLRYFGSKGISIST